MKTSKPLNKKAVFLTTILIFCVALFATAPHPCEAAAAEQQSAEILAKLGDAMANIAEKAKPAVVNISTTKTVKPPANPFFDDLFSRRFFGEGAGAPQKRKVMNLGSGIIASSDGYILTNNHVIEGAEDIVVRLHDNREVKGRVAGIDSKTDIAVIKINETNLPTMEWGDSEKLRVGEIVFAIGNPFGLSSTITMGIVSALGRSGMGITDYEDFIQTDAAINPGNSGGALVSIKGELIGLNTAILSRSGGYQGIGFAIPANMLKNIMDGILNQGKVSRGWLGVQIQPLTAELSKQFNLKDENGALLVDVVEGGPADKAGLKRGDVITEYDGRKIENPSLFKNMVASTRPGKTVRVRLVRDGSTLTTTVVVGELQGEQEAVAVQQADNSLKGVGVQDLTEEHLKKMNITKKLKGVVVTEIEPQSPAQGILAAGDIILEINRRLVTGSKDYQSVVSGIDKTQNILVLIVRGGVSQYITVPAAGK
ncbi:MAG: DegQ family serine endoprotease [Nitrospirae bacterium]|nr:MAG: DegQ family serine endoprotease [Nitrospirota bacterium]